MTVKKSKKLKASMPAEPIRDYKKAYAKAVNVVNTLADELDRLDDLLNWCAARMKNEVCRGTLSAMRNDPTQKHISEKPARKKPNSENDASSPESDVSPALVVEDLPEATANFLANTPEDKMDWIGGNFDHMNALRRKGLLVLVGADSRVSFPPRLSPLGRVVKKLAIERQTGCSQSAN